jgi:TonB-linked SusC/RagA family outer membrane protein
MKSKNNYLQITWMILVFICIPLSFAAKERHNASGEEIAQQTRRITGTVLDADNEPVIGASVSVAGTATGTVTDIDGQFTLDVPAQGVLRVSFIGYRTQELQLDGKTAYSVVLEENTEMLDEVVVMAYNTTVKRKLANAVTVVDVKQVSDLAAYPSLTSALQGRTPGVYISNSSGLPGSIPSLNIRGNNDSYTSPLYVIDGIVQDAETFNKLNSQDIESLNIMKDAASAAVYGAIAGNGVVVVKTRSGKSGRAIVNYTFDQQINEPTLWKDNLSSYDRALTTNTVRGLNGYDPLYTDEELRKYQTGTDPVNYPDVNWRDLIMRNVSTAKRHSLTLDGGNEDTQYHLSLGYYDQGSLMKPVSGNEVYTYNRFNAGVNITHRFKEIGLKVGLDYKGSLDNSKGKGESGASLSKTISTMRVYNEAGQYYANTPYLGLDINSGYTAKRKPITNTRLNLDWDVAGVKGLAATFVGNYRNWNSSEKTWSNAYVPSFYDDGSPYVATVKPSLMMRKDEGWRYEINAGLRYATVIADKHSLSVAGYYNQMEEYSEWIRAERKEYLSSAVDQLFAGPESAMLNNGGAAEKGRLGVIGVLNYDFEGRYILSGSFRYDGSDNYAKGNRWGFFPSVSLGWVISDESFLRSLKDALKVDLFKARASLGKTGVETNFNSDGTDLARFAQYANWSLGSANFDVDGQRVSLVNIPGLVSTDLSWYSTVSYNFGIDFAFLNNRLSGTVDYFYQDTKGYLINPLDIYRTTLGTALPQIKSDDQYRRAGAEFMLKWKSSVGELDYEIGGNVAFYDKMWLKKNEDLTTAANPLTSAVGKTTSDGERTWITDGLYQTAADLLNNPHATWASAVLTGDIRYVDVNGDGRIDTDATYSGDKVYNGWSNEPIMQYGMDFGVNYKGFFLNGLIQGAGTNYKKIGQNAMPMGVDRIRYTNELDYWTPGNTSARFPLLDIGTGTANNYQRDITFWMVNCAYIRLKNMQIGYDFKYKLLKKTSWLSNAKLSIAGQNLLTFSDATYYMDPEQGNTENNGYPITRTYSIVLTLGF